MGDVINLPTKEDETEEEYYVFTVNALGQDGVFYPIYFDGRDSIEAENIIRQLNIIPDEDGVCLLLEEDDGDWT